ncbi:hypothetical protein SADUNF_Sadunf02G0073600 [Salix dunnii]|uniref:Uncharacterized protein n=1 Tax=Salix dunnii TaxID=1413687 RepID=A0A835N6I0_9ROSI|nr:hypothetical protein SADUNF_Sadunf02G0073600 [Salix dunnii]
MPVIDFGGRRCNLLLHSMHLGMFSFKGAKQCRVSLASHVELHVSIRFFKKVAEITGLHRSKSMSFLLLKINSLDRGFHANFNMPFSLLNNTSMLIFAHGLKRRLNRNVKRTFTLAR